ncbi:MAG TPA: TIGR02302 family protein [Stellaceae bacterium]|nr:TIGR02302 family protein [Stellaceae bacterium]
MISPLTPDNRLSRLLLLSRAALAWERVWPALWPALFILGVFAVAALFDLFSWLSGPEHMAVLAGFALALGCAAVWAARRLAWPDTAAARRRIEIKSGLDHRPLATLADRPSGPLSSGATGLWEAHRRRVVAMIRGLRVGWPAAGLARHDPWGLRAILAILLVVAAIDAGADWRDRLIRALTPSWDGGTPGPAASFDIWITPPDYTGLPPQFLRADTAGTIRIPTGSKLLAQIHGGGLIPRLSIDDAATDFQGIDKTNFRAEATLTQGKLLSVSQGGTTLGRWPIEIIPDNPPVAAFSEPPKPTIHAALHLAYQATDDYGVENVKAVITRAGGNPADKIEIEMPLPGLHLKDAHGATYQDLSPHPWAGLPVDIRIVATDALGQIGASEPVRMTLPEREFHNPVARAIIDQRKELVKDPGSRDVVAEILDDLNIRPERYRDDTVVYLALRLAALRLREPDSDAAVAAVIPLLWDTALRIEDAGMSVAERDLRRLQQELQDALARGAPDEEIDRLMHELQQAMSQYLQALAQNMERNGDQTTEPTDPSHTLTGRDLQRMLDRARELAHSGAQQQARELLSQLQDMLENLQMTRPGAQQHAPNQAGQMMRGLQDLMQRQQQLLDRSFRAQRQMNGTPGQNGQQPGDDDSQPGDLGSAAGPQDQLRRALGEIMRQLGSGAGNIPDALGRAERAMRDATGALQRGDPGAAISSQSEALDQLQEGAREFAQQLRDKMQNGWEAQSADPNGYGQDPTDTENRDPFGRPLSGSFIDQGDVQIPDANILQKSREILDELRRRAGERARPVIELDYIERLLRRF